MHAEYGGVVPELASRDHVRKTVPLLTDMLARAGIELRDIDAHRIHRWARADRRADGRCHDRPIARVGARRAGDRRSSHGSASARAAARPIRNRKCRSSRCSCRAATRNSCASMRSATTRFVGESIDDAAGEAFDKTAKMLGLGYPGGPAVARLAERGNPTRFRFPRPMTDRPGLDFSFSGLKTFTLQHAAATRQHDRSGQSRRCARVRRRRRRHAGDQVQSRARADRARPVGDGGRRRREHALARRARRAPAGQRLLRAGGVVHRQRRNGRVRRLSAPRGRANTRRSRSKPARAGRSTNWPPSIGRLDG